MTQDYPIEFRSLIDELLGDDSPEFWQAVNHTPGLSGLRLNTLKKDNNTIVDRLPARLDPLPWIENGFLIKEEDQLGKHPFHTAGLYYLQEPSAMVPVEILDPKPGENVLDLCAAPGGKTTQILSKMNNQGWLLANDSNPRRVQALTRNLDRWGARNSQITSELPSRLAEHLGPVFDKVLVDAPCSGEATFRTDPRGVKNWSTNFRDRCTVIQDDILWNGAKLVRPGGILVYSTCTFNQKENEGTIMRFLERNQEFFLEQIPLQEGFSPGLPLNSSDRYGLKKTARIWPHRAPGEGHFIALLRRSGQMEKNKKPLEKSGVSLQNGQKASYKAFYSATMIRNNNTEYIHPDNDGLRVYGNQLYFSSTDSPPLDGLRVEQWGWWIGTFKENQFNPSPALAAGLSSSDMQKVLEFSLGDLLLEQYQRGSPIKYETGDIEAKGWILVNIEGYPLGWGKLSQGKIKNYLPRWLRR